MIGIGYHKTDDSTRFLVGVQTADKLHIITIPFVAPMDEVLKDIPADGLYEYFKPRIEKYIRERPEL